MLLARFLALVTFCCLLLPQHVFGQVVAGRITSTTGDSVSFATVVLVGTSKGAIADEAGNYALLLPGAGQHVLQIRSLGYAIINDTITMPSGVDTLRYNFRMTEEEIVSEMVFIVDGDPAEYVMRQAIKHRRANDAAVQAYSARVYTRMRITDLEQRAAEDRMDFFSESFSTVWVDEPDKVREVIHQSRVAGEEDGYSGVGAAFTTLNPYEITIDFEYITDRPFVSPVSPNAFFFYRFNYLGNFREQGQVIHKISMQPKRRADPVFAGTIYIVHGSFAIQGIDWKLTSTQPLKYLDSLRIKQTYVPVHDSLWVPFNNQVEGRINMGLLVERINLRMELLNVFTEYKISRPYYEPPRLAPPATPNSSIREARELRRQREKGEVDSLQAIRRMEMEPENGVSPDDPNFFKEVLRIDPASGLQGSNKALWDSLRPIQLTAPELAALETARDTFKVEEQEPETPDTTTVSTRKKRLNLWWLSGGKTFRFSREFRMTIPGIVNSLQFNTVEGINYTFAPSFRLRSKNRYNDDYLAWSLRGRYGFSSERFSYGLYALYHLDDFSNANLRWGYANYPVQFSEPRREVITPLENTTYSLFTERNFMRLYQQHGGYLQYSQNAFGPGRILFEARAYERQALENTTLQVFFPSDRFDYQPNLPGQDTVAMPTHRAAELYANVRWTFGRQFVNTPDGTFWLPSKWPTFSLGAAAGWAKGDAASGVDYRYQRLTFSLSSDLDLKLLGELRYLGRIGKIWSQGSDVQMPDRLQVWGNETDYLVNAVDKFGMLPYYTYATDDQMAEFHADHNFRGFIMNKIPLLRKLKLHTLVGLHGVAVPGRVPYLEGRLGITNIRIFRVSLFQVYYHRRIMGDVGRTDRFTLGIGLEL